MAVVFFAVFTVVELMESPVGRHARCVAEIGRKRTKSISVSSSFRR